MHKVLLLFFMFLWLVGFSRDLTEKDRMLLSELPITERKYPENWKKSYTGKAYEYESMQGEAENILARAINYFLNSISDIFGVELGPNTTEIFKIIIYILLVILAIYLIVRYTMNENVYTMFSTKSKKLNTVITTDEHIEEVDLEALEQQATKDGNYKLAIRYTFLRLLKQLSLDKLIQWEVHKTNSDYINEINNNELQSYFKDAVHTYEWVWYGDHPVEESAYQEANQHFKNLKQKLRYVK